MAALECGDVSAGRKWLCFIPLPTAPPPSGNGCDVGCIPCRDDVDGIVLRTGLWNTGKRWVRPWIQKRFPSRDAYGNYHSLQTGKTWRMPRVMWVQRAPCYRPDGSECFDLSVCDCLPRPSCSIVSECQSNELCSVLGSNTFPDCEAFTDYRWEPPDTAGWFHCRKWEPLEDGPLPIQLNAGGLGQAEFLRLGQVELDKHSGCTSNMAVPCLGHLPDYIDACDSFPDNPESYYIGDIHTGLWERCHVVEFDAKIETTSTRIEDGRVVALKNAAIEYVLSHPEIFALDQMDHPLPVQQNRNSSLDLWERGWPMTPVPFTKLPTVASLNNSRMQFSRCPVNVDVVVRKAGLQMSLVMYRKKTRILGTLADAPGNVSRTLWPLVRVKLSITLGLRATLPTECFLDRPWRNDQVEVTIHHNADGLPVVNNDKLIYVGDDGKPIEPPTTVVWKGYMGEMSDPAYQDVWDEDYYQSLGSITIFPHCCAVAESLNDLRISGDVMTDARPDVERIYAGQMQMRFPTEAAGCAPPLSV